LFLFYFTAGYLYATSSVCFVGLRWQTKVASHSERAKDKCGRKLDLVILSLLGLDGWMDEWKDEREGKSMYVRSSG